MVPFLPAGFGDEEWV